MNRISEASASAHAPASVSAPPVGVPSPRAVAALGALALASAMGIGRFAFTPMLPLMQAHAGLTLAQGGRLAAANYAGYLIGALACFVAPPAPPRSIRAGLAAVALATAATAAFDAPIPWAVLRFVAGVASAYVLVGVSTWSLGALAAAGRADWAGRVFAGVGLGITVAGAVGAWAGIADVTPAVAWLVLGGFAAVTTVVAWPVLARAGSTVAVARRVHAPHSNRAASASGNASVAAVAMANVHPFDARSPDATRRTRAVRTRLVVAYAAFGFGYILPATFLPALARQFVPDPRTFGLIWPAFGVAAAASTPLAMKLGRRTTSTRVWAVAQCTMAAGVVAPLLVPGVVGLLAGAILVGGTFMVVTMAGLQTARAFGGEHAARLAAAMTAAFALGQWVGPLTLSAGLPIAVPSAVACAALLAGAALVASLPPPPR